MKEMEWKFNNRTKRPEEKAKSIANLFVQSDFCKKNLRRIWFTLLNSDAFYLTG
jgi:hypothetical protein